MVVSSVLLLTLIIIIQIPKGKLSLAPPWLCYAYPLIAQCIMAHHSFDLCFMICLWKLDSSEEKQWITHVSCLFVTFRFNHLWTTLPFECDTKPKPQITRGKATWETETHLFYEWKRKDFSCDVIYKSDLMFLFSVSYSSCQCYNYKC